MCALNGVHSFGPEALDTPEVVWRFERSLTRGWTWLFIEFELYFPDPFQATSLGIEPLCHFVQAYHRKIPCDGLHLVWDTRKGRYAARDTPRDDAQGSELRLDVNAPRSRDRLATSRCRKSTAS